MEGENNQKINEQDNSVTLTKENVKITVSFMDRNKLGRFSDNIRKNPYINDNKILFTVFNVKIENMRKEKIFFSSSKCVILDGQGNQYNALSMEDFKRFYPTTSTNSLSYSYVFDEYVPTIVYTSDYYKREVLAKTLLKDGDIYPSVKKDGLVVFGSVGQNAKKITVIIPSVKIYENNEVKKKIDFYFYFLRETRVEQ